MTASSSSEVIHECRIESLDTAACRELVEGVNREAAPQPFRWLLAHCDDGVIWGRRDDSRRWLTSSTSFPDVSPKLVERRIQQLRFFGSSEEILIWRTSEGLRGRRLVDDLRFEKAHPLRHAEEIRILLGDRVVRSAHAGFTLVGDANGSCHAVPIVCTEDDFRDENWPLRLSLHHFVARDSDTGVVRIAASRLVNVWIDRKERHHGSAHQSD